MHMAQFLVQVAYSPEAWASLVKNPQNRIPAVSAVIKKLGGKLLQGWLSFGEYDTVVIMEMPDNVSAAAFAVAIAAGGSCKSVKTTPLLSPEDGVAAMKKAGSSGYQPLGK
jgi:uncharacterized protein with GYD domain